MGQHSTAQHSQLAAGGGYLRRRRPDPLLLLAGCAVGSVSYLSKHGSCFDSVECYVCVCARDISPYIVYTWDVTVYLIPASVLGRPVVFSSLFQPGERESQVQPSGEQSSISSTANPFAVRCISHPSDEPFCPSFPPIDWRNSTLCRCSAPAPCCTYRQR